MQVINPRNSIATITEDMGVYIPPPSGSGKSPGDETTEENKSQTESRPNTSNIAKIPTVNKVLSMLFPNVIFPQNPSFGLRMWGPLVPASDNQLALYGLATFQAMIGMYMLGRARRLRKANYLRVGLPYPKGRLRDNLVLIGVGSVAIFQSGLEYARLMILGHLDAWSVEAAKYRNLVKLEGREKASWWFGAYKYYTPMSLDEYRRRLRKYIQLNENYLNGEGWKIAQNLNDLKYLVVYEKMVKQNQALMQDLLNGDLKDMTELNKAERLDEILEGTSHVQVVEDKPTIQLGNHKLDTDDDLDYVWSFVDPWDELNGAETLMSFIPKSTDRATMEEDEFGIHTTETHKEK